MSEEDFSKADVDEYEDENQNENSVDESISINEEENHAHYQPKKDEGDDDTVKYQLSGMYQNWFLD